MDVVDVTPIESKPLNLDEELGIPAPQGTQQGGENTPSNAKFDENSSKNVEYGGAN
jgi:hypothetical protein